MVVLSFKKKKNRCKRHRKQIKLNFEQKMKEEAPLRGNHISNSQRIFANYDNFALNGKINDEKLFKMSEIINSMPYPDRGWI